MSKTDALVQLEKFFYQGLEHKGVQLPAAINFKPLVLFFVNPFLQNHWFLNQH
jgi:hypothetical protein